MRAKAQNNDANRAACHLLAEALGLPRTQFSILSGHTSRLKLIAIACQDKAQQDAVHQLLVQRYKMPH